MQDADRLRQFGEPGSVGGVKCEPQRLDDGAGLHLRADARGRRATRDDGFRFWRETKMCRCKLHVVGLERESPHAGTRTAESRCTIETTITIAI
jgi:hypothetical protein